ncbi:MAG: alpha/beta hydrolase domain-containing protein [Chloroflexi bacterium]|nr:alpha/beta hydrolase domain-containing protein [Chloroflexota bacterium]MDA1004086.1 alpha/beta hydrolase domain-containing protein [Chloroflexota bacterium]MQC28012.1 hypothetical protein [Chloroflexota bacterium]
MSVTKIEYTTEPFDGGRAFGDAGAYELLSGTVHFAFDPGSPANQVITDIALAPTDGEVRVTCSADFAILRAVDPNRGNRRLFFDILNRGNRIAPGAFDVTPAPRVIGEFRAGDGWLLGQGYTIAWCGWQHDVPESPHLLKLHAPEALRNGERITGPVTVRYEYAEAGPVQPLSHGIHIPYTVANTDEAGAVLTVRDFADGPPAVIPREQWRFARLDGERVVASDQYLHLPAGFVQGRFYEVTYTAIGAPLTGIGLAATRDLVSFLRHAGAADANPLAGKIDHAYAFGASQSGGFLRQLMYFGLHEDEAGRLVFDGVMPHIAGAFRGEFNWRFGQPSYFGPYSAAYAFPFADATQTEPTRRHTDGLHARVLAKGNAPKVMYTNTSAEYWSLWASLAHTALDGRTDVPVPEHVRLYHFAGTHHGGAVFPPAFAGQLAPRERVAVNVLNTVDQRPLLRAVLANLCAWVEDGVVPPPSRHGRLDDGTLVERDSLRPFFDRIPGSGLPLHLACLGDLDFGPEPYIASQLPPRMGPPYPLFASAVDSDGNELRGIRHPDLAVPLATHTGWNVRDPDTGGVGQYVALTGSTIPFARTAGEREAAGDPRPSIAERYASRDDYLGRVRAYAEQLVGERYMLAGDVDSVVEAAGQRWDVFAG